VDAESEFLAAVALFLALSQKSTGGAQLAVLGLATVALVMAVYAALLV